MTIGAHTGNSERLLAAIGDEPACSQDLAEATGLKFTVVSALLSYLRVSGYIERAGLRPSTGHGRPWVLYRCTRKPLASIRGRGGREEPNSWPVIRKGALEALQRGPMFTGQLVQVLGCHADQLREVLVRGELAGLFERHARVGQRREITWMLAGDRRPPLPLEHQPTAFHLRGQVERDQEHARVVVQRAEHAARNRPAPVGAQTVDEFIARGGYVEVIDTFHPTPAIVRPAFPGSR